MVNWTEIKSENRPALEAMAAELHVHPLALEDCINRDQRAKLEEYDTHQFLVWFMIAEGKVYEIQFLIFPEQIVMVPHDDPPSGATWWEYLRLNENAKDVLHLLYQALDRATDITWHEVEKLFKAIDNFELRIFQEDCDPMILMGLKTKLSEADYYVGHLASVAEQIQKNFKHKDDLRWKLRDLHDHCQRIYRDMTLYRSQVSSTIELYWGFQANRANRQIQKLSVLASVAVPLTFWASFWGMNFETIPFHSPELFYIAIAVMIISTSGIVWFLVKKGYWAD